MSGKLCRTFFINDILNFGSLHKLKSRTMQTEQYVTEKIQKQGLMPLFYHDHKSTCIAITKALYDAGNRLIEFTNRGENALANFKAIAAEIKMNMPGLLLGAGTIKNDDDAISFIE